MNRRVVQVQVGWLKMLLGFIHVQFVGYALCVLLTYSNSFKLWHTSINIHWVKQPIHRNQLSSISRSYTRYTDIIVQLDSLLLLL